MPWEAQALKPWASGRGRHLLEGGDLAVAEVLLPVEGGRAVVGQQLARELGVHAVRELLGLLHVGLGRLHPDHVAVGGVRDRARDAGLHHRNKQGSAHMTA